MSTEFAAGVVTKVGMPLRGSPCILLADLSLPRCAFQKN